MSDYDFATIVEKFIKTGYDSLSRQEKAFYSMNAVSNARQFKLVNVYDNRIAMAPLEACYHYNPDGDRGLNAHYALKDAAVQHPINGLWHSNALNTQVIYHEGRVYKTLPLSNMVNCMVAKHFSVPSSSQIPFHAHTGDGTGNPKTFTKPSGEAFGIEIETVFANEDPLKSLENKINFCFWLKENFPEWIVERDGSLETGIKESSNPSLTACTAEIVSPPLETAVLLSQLERVVKALSRFGARGLTYGDFFGTHITINIQRPEDISIIARIVRAVNKTENRHFWQQISQRPDFDGFVGKLSHAYCKFDDVDKLQDYDIYSLVCSNGHYRATFGRGSGRAIELRIFLTRINLHYYRNLVSLMSLLSRYGHEKIDIPWLEFVKSEANSGLRNLMSSSNCF